jgi:hypothetical protein
MDLRLFYQKLRKIEQEITDAHVMVVSHETSDGGRAGQKSEVSRSNAARLILEGRARLAPRKLPSTARRWNRHAKKQISGRWRRRSR